MSRNCRSAASPLVANRSWPSPQRMRPHQLDHSRVVIHEQDIAFHQDLDLKIVMPAAAAALNEHHRSLAEDRARDEAA